MGSTLRLLPPFFGLLSHAAHATASSSALQHSQMAAAAVSGLDIPWWVWAAVGAVALMCFGFWMAGWGSDPEEETYG